MQKIQNLVIVESPAKAKTIEKFLGKDYKVLSSYGHIRDLQKKDFGVDLDKDFTPHYIITEDKKELVQKLKKTADLANMVWLASDEDREGEAIAWHLYEVLEREGKPTKRIVFHEITSQAIERAIENPRDIDLNLVDAQQARRVLDRIVGFELSPILWKRIKPSLSAGRVQSVAVRIIVDREREIRSFQTNSSYKIIANVSPKEKNVKFDINAIGSFLDGEEAIHFIQSVAAKSLIVQNIEKKPSKRSPSSPFTTSTLQQEAARKLGFSVSVTMRVAQKLYEAGHITYMRTDSVNLSSLALNSIAKIVKKDFGEEYYQKRSYKTKSKGAQEAHEAIRPTYLEKEMVGSTLQEQKLYDLIRKRTIATQMADANIERSIILFDTEDKKNQFSVEGEVITFEGFLAIYNYKSKVEDEEENHLSSQLPVLEKGEKLEINTLRAVEKYTLAPSRYSEASLVRKMEELGIGRPSTYAPTIQTIQNREYVERGTSLGKKRVCNDYFWDSETMNSEDLPKLVKREEKFGGNKGRLIPTDIGEVVNDYLVENFPRILDYNFTAKVEEEFDSIAQGTLPWTKSMQQFYSLFHPMVEEALDSTSSNARGERFLGYDPKTEKPVSVRIGRFGALVQMGSTDDKEKPLFASLLAGQSIQTISLEEALDLFKLPRLLGEYNGESVKVAIGRFGPYAKYAGGFVSIPKDMDVLKISLEEIISLIKEKEAAAERALLKKFEEDSELFVLDGRFGAYIKKGKTNYKLTKEQKTRAADLSYTECVEIIEASNSGKSKGVKTTKKTKSVKTKRKK